MRFAYFCGLLFLVTISPLTPLCNAGLSVIFMMTKSQVCYSWYPSSYPFYLRMDDFEIYKQRKLKLWLHLIQCLCPWYLFRGADGYHCIFCRKACKGWQQTRAGRLNEVWSHNAHWATTLPVIFIMTKSRVHANVYRVQQYLPFIAHE